MGVVTQLVGARLLCAVALASMMPISQSILTDAVPSSRRGAAFGKLGFWSSMGQVPPLTPFGWSKSRLLTRRFGLSWQGIGGTVSTLIAGQVFDVGFGEVHGWRLAFLGVGVSSVILGILIQVRR